MLPNSIFRRASMEYPEVGPLPLDLKSLVAPTVLGFAPINGCTFGVCCRVHMRGRGRGCEALYMYGAMRWLSTVADPRVQQVRSGLIAFMSAQPRVLPDPLTVCPTRREDG